MKVIYYDPLVEDKEFTSVSLEDLFKRADFISLHAPLTKDTEKMVGEKLLSLMKEEAFLINTARGELINEEALYRFLQEKRIKGAALDVLEEEGDIKEEQELMVKGAIKEPEQLKTLILNHLLIDLDNVLISPHNAFNTFEGLASIISTTLDNIKAYISNQPQNIVSARLTL